MTIGRLEIYSYKTKGEFPLFHSYTNDPFYGKNRVFRWNFFVLNRTIDVNLWRKR